MLRDGEPPSRLPTRRRPLSETTPRSSRCRAAEQLCGLPEPEEDDDEEREVVTFEHSEEGDKADEARPC